MTGIDRETGFNTQCYSEKKGHRLIEIRGTGKYNNDYAFLRLVDGWEKRVTKKGITIFNLDNNLNILSQVSVDTITDINNHTNISNVINSFPINTLFFMVSYESITAFMPDPSDRKPYFYNFMVDALNSPNFHRINFNFDYKCSTPYVCAGVIGRGIMYEAIGDTASGSSDPHAFLQISYAGIASFGANGFGSNLADRDFHVMQSNNSAASGTGTISVAPMKSSGGIRFEIRGKTRATTANSEQITFNIKKNGSTIHTMTFTKNLPTRKHFETIGNTNDTFEIEYSFNGRHDISGLWVYENTAGNNNKFSFSKRTIASEGHFTSPIGVNPCDIDKMLLVNDQPQNLPYNNLITLGDQTVDATAIGAGQTATSNFIEIDPIKTYWFSGYANCSSGGYKSITVTFYFYDANMLPTNVYTATGTANSISNTGSIDNNAFYLSIPIHGKYSQAGLDTTMFRTGGMDQGGLDAFDQLKSIRMDTNVKYVKYAIQVEEFTRIALPCFLEQKFGITNQNTTLGEINEV